MHGFWRWLCVSLLALLFLSAASGGSASTGSLTLLSTNGAGVKALGLNTFDMSDDGSKVAFTSYSSDLVSPGPPFGQEQVYVKDVASGALTLVSADTGGNLANGESFLPHISRNGRFVAFVSNATNLDGADTDANPDLYIKDLSNGSIRLASTNSAGVKGNQTRLGGGGVAISNDGTKVAYSTNASNFDPRHLPRTCGSPSGPFDCTELELYLKDLTTGAVTLLTAGSNNRDGSTSTTGLSADGSKVLVATYDSLTPQDTDSGDPDVYVYDVPSATYTLVSTNLPSGTTDSQAIDALEPDISADGHRVVFQSYGLPGAGLTSFQVYVYAKNLDTGAVDLASSSSQGTAANNLAQDPQISGDGNLVSFNSTATNLDPAVTDVCGCVYLKNLATGELKLASQTDDGTKPNFGQSLSAPANGGGAVVFMSDSNNLDPGDTDRDFDVYRKVIAPPNPDANGDGIFDSLQPSGTPAGSFVDTHVPPTTGSIVNGGGLTVTVIDGPNPDDGVQITTSAGTGSASFSVCGGFTLRVAAGSTVVITCGSVTVKTITGSAEIVLGGGVTVVSIAQNGIATVSDSGSGMYKVVNRGTTAITVTVDGTTGTISAGANATLATWHFVGFSQPVDNLPTLNKMKAGQAVPIKWRLLDRSNTPVTNLAAASITVTSLNCATGTTIDQIEETVAGASGLQNLGSGYYQLNWKSPTTYANSCKTLHLNVGDGVTHDADFQFTK